MKTILKKMYWWLIYTVSNLRFVIISRKEYRSLLGKSEKYDIYLQKSKARKAKASAKAKELRKEFIDFVKKNIGNCYSVPDFGTCFLCGYSKDLRYVVLGSDVNDGWKDTSNCVILKEYKYYKYCFFEYIEPIEH